ncbi:hypothetical protein HJFPF1_04834 [Paramyrothecium foliicola]|nr:hypothetical protein HJFPF1_04834 [Paramyrothecium foliicola]
MQQAFRSVCSKPVYVGLDANQIKPQQLWPFHTGFAACQLAGMFTKDYFTMAASIRQQVVPDPVNFPKVRVEDVPVNERKLFKEFYPNGLPNVYKIMHGSENRVSRDYLEDNLPVGFYTSPPASAKALFSTMDGQRKFRSMKHILPRRKVHLWTRDEIQSACNSLRQVYHHHMKSLLQPYCWDDLWTHFDAYDLYHYGILNLWNVINHLYYENQIIYADVMKEFAVQAGHWVDTWLSKDKNRRKLLSWTENDGMILSIFDKEDRQALGNIQDEVLPLLATALKGRRVSYIGKRTGPGSAKPTDLITACRADNLQNWLVGERKFAASGLPPAPASAPDHIGSGDASPQAPCFVHRGTHYYNPSEQNDNDKPTHRSTADVSTKLRAPSTGKGVVIAVGSSQFTPGMYPRLEAGELRQRGQSAGWSQAEEAITDDLFVSGSNPGRPRAKSTPAPIANEAWRDRLPQTVDDTPTDLSTAPSEQAMIEAPSSSSIGKMDTQVQNNPVAKANTALDKTRVNGLGTTVDLHSRPTIHDNAQVQDLSHPTPLADQTAQIEASHTVSGLKSVQNSTERFLRPQTAKLEANSVSAQQAISSENLILTTHYPDVQHLPNKYSAGPRSFQASQSRRLSSGTGYWPSHNDGQRTTSANQFRLNPMMPSQETYYQGGGRKGLRQMKLFNGKGTYRQNAPSSFSSPTDEAFTPQTHGGNGLSSLCPNQVNRPGGCYIACNCHDCNLRNRTVYVRVQNALGYSEQDVKSCLKTSFSERYGEVEQVMSSNLLSFQIRFVEEISASDALRAARGTMPENHLEVTILPIHRSKWSGSASSEWNDRRSEDFKQPLGPSHPMAHHGNHTLALSLPSTTNDYHMTTHTIRGPSESIRGLSSYQSHSAVGYGRPTTTTSAPINTHEPFWQRTSPRHHYQPRSRTTSLQTPPKPSRHNSAQIATHFSDTSSQTEPAIREETLQSKSPAELDLDPAIVSHQVLSSSSTNIPTHLKPRVFLPSPKKGELGQDSQSLIPKSDREPQTPTPLPLEPTPTEQQKGKDTPADQPGDGSPKSRSSSKVSRKTQAHPNRGTAIQSDIASDSEDVEPKRAQSSTTHKRVGSIYTAEQIEARKHASNRIPMPILPRKPVPSRAKSVNNLMLPSPGDMSTIEANKETYTVVRPQGVMEVCLQPPTDYSRLTIGSKGKKSSEGTSEKPPADKDQVAVAPNDETGMHMMHTRKETAPASESPQRLPSNEQKGTQNERRQDGGMNEMLQHPEGNVENRPAIVSNVKSTQPQDSGMPRQDSPTEDAIKGQRKPKSKSKKKKGKKTTEPDPKTLLSDEQRELHKGTFHTSHSETIQPNPVQAESYVPNGPYDQPAATVENNESTHLARLPAQRRFDGTFQSYPTHIINQGRLHHEGQNSMMFSGPDTADTYWNERDYHRNGSARSSKNGGSLQIPKHRRARPSVLEIFEPQNFGPGTTNMPSSGPYSHSYEQSAFKRNQPSVNEDAPPKAKRSVDQPQLNPLAQAYVSPAKTATMAGEAAEGGNKQSQPPPESSSPGERATTRTEDPSDDKKSVKKLTKAQKKWLTSSLSNAKDNICGPTTGACSVKNDKRKTSQEKETESAPPKSPGGEFKEGKHILCEAAWPALPRSPAPTLRLPKAK